MVLRLLRAGGMVLVGGLVVLACSTGGDEPDESAAADSATETSVGFGDATDAAAEAGADDSDDSDAGSASAPEEQASTDAEVAAIEAAVEQVIQRNWEIWVECTTDSESCDPSGALAETENTTGQFYQESVGVVELWKQQGIAYRAVGGRPADRFVEVRSIEVAPDGMSAEVVLCDRDDRARFQRNADGDYEMVEGTDIGEDLLLRRVLVREDGVWKISENELIERRLVQEGIDPLC